MGIAIKYGAMVDDPIVDDDGKLAIRGGAGALVERLLKIYPGACLVGYEDRQCDGFEMKRDINLDAEKDLVINLDVMDSVGVFQVMHRHGAEPMIMNLQWLPPRHYHHKVNFAAMGLSYALFPTLCSGSAPLPRSRSSPTGGPSRRLPIRHRSPGSSPASVTTCCSPAWTPRYPRCCIPASTSTPRSIPSSSCRS